MPSYSKRAMTALAYLFRPYNDIDVFVEDKACRNLYEVLLTRMLEGKAKVEKVFQLGGRDAVIEECAKNQENNERNVLYLIDGDFDILFCNERIPLTKLYQLQVYCSENLVMSEEAIIELAKECLPNSNPQEIANRINYTAFININVNILRPLFIVYALIIKLGAGLETCGFNVSQLLEKNGNTNILSQKKTEDRINFLMIELLKTYDQKQINEIYENLKKMFTDKEVEDSKFISGKTYLIPLLFYYLKDNASFSGTLDQLKVRLARHCNLMVDPRLKEAVQNASRGIYN